VRKPASLLKKESAVGPAMSVPELSVPMVKALMSPERVRFAKVGVGLVAISNVPVNGLKR